MTWQKGKKEEAIQLIGHYAVRRKRKVKFGSDENKKAKVKIAECIQSIAGKESPVEEMSLIIILRPS